MFDNRYVAVLADTEKSLKIHDDLRYESNCLDQGDESTEKEGIELIDNAVHFIVLDNREWRWLATLSIFLTDAPQLPLAQHVDLERSVKNNVLGGVAKLSGLSLIPKYEHQNRGRRSVTTKRRKAETTEICLGLVRAAKDYCNTNGLKHGLLFTAKSLTPAFRQSGLNIQSVETRDKASAEADYPCYMNLDNIVDGTANASSNVFEIFKKSSTYYRYSKLARVFSDLPGSRVELPCAA